MIFVWVAYRRCIYGLCISVRDVVYCTAVISLEPRWVPVQRAGSTEARVVKAISSFLFAKSRVFWQLGSLAVNCHVL